MRDIEHLYDVHSPDLLAYLRRSFGRFAAAEDLLQETFVQALRHRDRLERALSPRAWLFGVARNVGMTARRRHRPTAELNPLAAPQQPELLAMREAIENLSQPLREALQLRLREQLSYEEIAELLEIPLGTVRSRLHAAMRTLRESLTDRNSHHEPPNS